MNNNYNSLCDSMDTSRKRSWQTKIAALLFFVMFSVFGVNAQVTTNGGSGLAGTYGSLSAAVTALNAATITAPVVITLSGNETAPVGGYNITATGTSTNTITIQGSSSTITAATGLTSGAFTDAIFKITGGDWITIQNFTMQENAANTTTTAASNNMTEFGVALFYTTTTNGAQNCTIQNNTISLNRTYANTFGVYSNSTHSATSVTTSATATTTSGGNSGLKVYGNAISNVNMGILVVGPTAVADVNTGIDIGGASSGTGNTITNYGTTGTFSGFANVSGTVNGILVRNSNGFNISYNSITSSNGGVTSGTLNGIQVAAASNTPTGTFTNNITNNTISLTTGFSGAINGVNYPSGSASTTSVLNVNNNNFTAATSTVTNSGTIVLISIASTNLTTNINSNTFTNIVSNTTGSFTFIGHGYTMPAGGSQTINGNSIVTAFSKTGAGGTVTIATSGSSSPNGTTHTFTNNNFSNITVTGATGITGVTNSDGSSSSATRTVTGNTFNNWTGGTSSITAINYGYIGGTTSTISNNTVTNITGQSTITGVNIGSSASLATTLNVANNTISNLTSTGTGGAVTGLSCSNASTTINVNSNAINTLSSTGASAVTGLSIGGAATTNVYQNKIYNLSGSNASSTVNGILISAGTNVNTYNNIIGDLRATAASGNDVIRGISITSTTATSNQRVYYNTVYLNGTSSGTNFGSSGVFQTYSATATTAALDLRNNIIVNASGANGTGLAVAFRRSSATDLNNYASTSNNNLFFGTSGAFNNGTNYAFGAFQTLVTPRETASKSQNPTFASTTGANANFLNFASGAISLAGGNAQVLASPYTTDYSGASRDGSAPDMGAFEFTQGTITAPTITGFTTAFSPSAPIYLCSNGGSVVTITGTGFDTVSSVLFNSGTGVDIVGTITGQTATSLTVTAPAGVVDGVIRVTNPAGSVDSSTAFTTADPPTVGVSSAVTICSGTSTTLTATGANTYAWSPSTGLSATTGASVTANPTVNTTYTVIGTNTAGCTASNTVAVSVSPVASAVTVTKNPTSVCIGGITTLTATGGTVVSTPSSYGVAGTTGTYTAITGTTLGANAIGDDVGIGNLPIGFSFPYNGGTQTVFAASSNGLILLGNTTAALTGFSANALATTANAISALWDDNNTTGGSIIYSTTGTAPNRVLTVQWTGMHVAGSGSSSNPTIDMQILLYENGNIQFNYGSQSAALSSPTATIGISGASGNYISVTPLSPIATSTTSTTVENTAVNTSNIPSGTILTFTKPNGAVLAWSPSTDLFTDAAATVPYSGGTQTVVYSKSNSAQTYTATSTLGSCPVSGSVTVTPNALPTISANGSSSICAGGAGASLSATGGVSYLWAPATGLSFADVASPTATPSTTTTYTVTGTDANGCKNTATATVTVNTPVAITTQPANQTAVENSSASFSVVATGTGLSYQWQTYNGSTWDDISGETAATYTIATAPSTLNNSQYRVVVSGTAPCAAVTSTAVTLLVGSVAITTQPANQTICSNASATYSITTTGTITSYQWQYTTNGTNWFDLDGQTTDTLVLSGLTTANTGMLVRCSVNAGALYSNSASLTVYDAIVFGTQPASQSVCEAASVTFTSAATGSGLAYQWQFSTNGGSSWSNVASAGTSATYTISSPTGAMNGNQYRVIASGTSPCSAVTSDVATLSVISVSVAASPTSICLGSSTTLTATFTGSPASASSSWLCATTGSGATTAVTTNPAIITPTAAGTYTYTYTTNGTCSFTKTVAVTVNAAPVITTATATPATVCSGSTINLAATSISVVAGIGTIGTGTSLTSATTQPTAFCNRWPSYRMQTVYTAAELQAAGLAAGNITSMAFNITTLGDGATNSGFTVKIGNTASSTLSGDFVSTATGFTTVYPSQTYTHTATGWQTIPFSTPFAWNGTSNIIVEVIHNGADATNNSITTYTATTGNTVAYTSTASTNAASFSTNRLNVQFGGQVSTNLAPSYTWSWSPGSLSGVTATTSITNTSGSAVTQAFTATATSATGCTSSLATSVVTINSTIPTPTGTNSSQCGTGTPTCSVTGTGISGNTFHWYLVSTNGTALAGQSASTLSSYSISADTTFYVSEVSADGLCESPRVAVTATVTSPFAFTLSSSTATNCSGSPSLTPVTIATNGGYTSYSWSNSATVSGNETAGWYFSPTTTTTYTVTATGGGCSTTATVTVTPVALPVVNVSASPAAICVGASSTLTATTDVVAAGNATIGAGATTSATYSNPFYSAWSNNHTQHLITAAELTAMGLRAGNITSVALDVTSAGTLPMIDLSVKIGATSATSMSSFVSNAGFQTVYTSASLLPTVGSNVLTFSTPFNWNGTSNIVLEFCHGNAASTATMSRTVKADTTSYVSSIKAQISAATSAATICGDTTSQIVTYSVRPQFKFAGQVVAQGTGTLAYTWNDPSSTTGNVLTVSPTTTTAYTVYGLNGTTGCTGSATANVTVYTLPTAPVATNGARCGTGVVTTATVADSNGYTTPTFKWYADDTTTTALQTSTSTSYTTSISATTTLYVSVVSPGGCESGRNPITLTVNTPATLTVSPAANVCTGGSTTLVASGAVSYTWSPALGLNGTTTASVIATPSATTTYSVTGIDANGCTTPAATVTVTVNPYPSAVTITNGAASVCTNSVMSLTATGGTISGSGTATLGTGTLTSGTTSYPNPLSAYYGGVKHQMLYTVAELQAQGLSAGSTISAIKFSLNAFTANACTDLTIRMGTTSNTALSGFVTGTSTVYGPTTFTPSATGLVTFNLVTPYAWNGTSNLVVEVVHNAGNGGNGSGTQTNNTATAFNSVFYGATDNVTGGIAGFDALTTWSSTGASVNRPNTLFTYTSVTPTTITWSPTTDLYTDAGATTAYTGGNATVVYTKPSAERVYTATAANGTCAISSAATTITPEALPMFTVSENVTICKGQSTTLSTTGTGLTYVWSPALGLNGTTTASVVANPTATTTYTVEATNAAGCKSTQTVTVTVSEPGAILSGTTSQIAIATGSTTFSVTTASGATYTYQWQVSTNGGSSWTNLENDDHYSNVTTATLTLSDILSSYDNNKYQCLVTGASPCATLTPIVATLTVSDTGIEQQPQSVTVCAPGTTQFTIVTNGDEPFGIQWQMSTDNGATYTDLAEGTDVTTGLSFSGVDTTTLNVSNITLANNGVKFICMLNFFLLSDSATLTVKQAVSASNPSNQTVCASGGTATFNTTATGSDLTYQWQYSTNGGTTWNPYTGTGATTASISLVNPVLGLNGSQYRVMVSGNAACSAVTTAAATLFINNPTITTAPSAVTVLRGNTATFTVVASAATSYQWQRSATLNGTYVNVVDDTPTGNTYSGADTASLAVATSVTTATGGGNYYRCVVTNDGCTVTSTGALLTVNWYCTPAPTSVDGTGITNVTMGDINNTTGDESGHYGDYTSLGTSADRLSTVNFSVTYATGFTYGTKIWIDFNDNASFTDSGEQVYFGLSTNVNPTTLSGSFSIPLTAPLGAHRMRIGGSDADAGVDPCYASTFAAFEDYTITINPAPTCSGAPVAGTVTAGSTSLCLAGLGTTLTLSGTTSGVLGISRQWYYSSNGTTFTAVSGETGTTLSTGSLTANAFYYCTVTCSESGLSTDSNTVAITVNDPLITGSTPAGRCGTGTVTLQATATAGATINWYAASANGASLGTGTSFTTPSISATTTYYAEASTTGGLRSASGLGNTATPTSTGASAERGIVFTATSNGTIVSAQYYSPTLNVTNTVTVRLLDNTTGTQIGSSLSLPIVQGATAGFYTMNLNLPVTAGTTYRLLAAFSQSVNRISTGADYSSAAYNNLGSLGTITSGYDGGVSTTSYNYFHNIVAVLPGCTSARTAVVATVTPQPTATITYSGSPYCGNFGLVTPTITGTNAYTGGTWSSTDSQMNSELTTYGDGSFDTNLLFSTTTATYPVTYTIPATGNCAAQPVTVNVSVKQSIYDSTTADFGYSSSSICTTGGTINPILSTPNGVLGTFSATPSGLSLNATTGAIVLGTSTPGTYTVTNTVTECSQNFAATFTITVNQGPSVATQPVSTTVCSNGNTSFSATGTGTGVTYLWEVSTNGTTWTSLSDGGVYSGTASASLSITGATVSMNTYQYHVLVSDATGCGSVTSNAATLTVNQPAAPVITPTLATICTGSIQTLTADGGSVTKYTNSFDVLPSNFSTSTVGTGTPTAVLSTTLQAEGTGSVRFNTASTSANVAYSMNGNVDLSGLSSAQLTFNQIAAMEGSSTSWDIGYIEYSTNGGSTWTTFPTSSYAGSGTLITTQGTATAVTGVIFSTKSYSSWISAITGSTVVPTNTLWKAETINIPTAALTNQFRMRFRYTTDSSTNYYGWMIDNVKISAANATVWSPVTDLYTNAGATTPYTGTNLQTVYAKPTAPSTTYTVTNTNSLGCTNSSTVTVNVNAPSTLSSITQPTITCSGSQTTFNLTGLIPNSTSTLGYTINSVAQTAITGVVADASGNATFTVALPAVNNGRTLAITSITRTDLTPSCATTISANNTVVIAVQPLVTYYADADGDGFGNNAVTQITCQGQPSGYVTNNTDCDDTDNTKHASFTFYADTDGDGYGAGTAVSLCAVDANTPPTAGYVPNNTDCNDADATKNASFPFYVDGDADGFGAGSLVSVCAVNSTTPPTGYSLNGTDCNDADATKNASYPFYADADADGYGAGSAVSVCAVNATTPPAGYSLNGTDCNDADATKHASFTFYADTDGDGYGAGTAVTLCAVDANTPPTGYSLTNDDCNDANAAQNPTSPCSSVVTVTANIEGYYDTATHAMRPVLANQGVGSSSTDVDNITVQLYRDTDLSAPAYSTTAMLQTNGTAVATFTSAPSGSFYVVVKHRNSMETWSANPVTVGATPAAYNFADSASKAYGNNMKMLETGVYGFYSGDINQDGFIEIQDFTPLTNDSDLGAEGFNATDLNGDGFVEILDYPYLNDNSDAGIELLRP